MKCGNLRDALMEVVLSGESLATPAVEEHLASCRTCAQEVASLRQTMELLDEWKVKEPSPYFSARLHARMREEEQRNTGWFAWLRRPAIVTAAAALVAVGAGMLGGAKWKVDHPQRMAGSNMPTVSAVGDLQYLDSHADLFSDFDALDDSQTETN